MGERRGGSMGRGLKDGKVQGRCRRQWGGGGSKMRRGGN